MHGEDEDEKWVKQQQKSTHTHTKIHRAHGVLTYAIMFSTDSIWICNMCACQTRFSISCVLIAGIGIVELENVCHFFIFFSSRFLAFLLLRCAVLRLLVLVFLSFAARTVFPFSRSYRQFNSKFQFHFGYSFSSIASPFQHLFYFMCIYMAPFTQCGGGRRRANERLAAHIHAHPIRTYVVWYWHRGMDKSHLFSTMYGTNTCTVNWTCTVYKCHE